MSETSFPFQGQAVADASAPEPAPSGSRTPVLVLLGVLALLVVGLLAYFFVFSGGDDGADATGTPPPAPVAPAAPAETPATAPKPVKDKISAKSFGRDPFEPLVVDPAAVAGAESGTAPGSGTSDGSTTSDTGSTSDAGSTGGSSTGDAAPSAPTASSSHSFKVVDVAPDNSSVTVKVDGDLYRNLKAGDVFAEMFKVRFIGGSVNSFQIGDEVFNVAGGKKVTIAG
jgi:hypothetical protein